MNKYIIVGHNASNNWEILSKAKQNHIWFHLDNFSSPYVILQKTLKECTKNEIKNAATTCKKNSKYKNLPNVSVIYCEIKNVKKGSTVGQAIIKSNKKCKKIVV